MEELAKATKAPMSYSEWYLSQNPTCNGIDARLEVDGDDNPVTVFVAYWERPPEPLDYGTRSGPLRYGSSDSILRVEIRLDPDNDIRYTNYLLGLGCAAGAQE